MFTTLTWYELVPLLWVLSIIPAYLCAEFGRGKIRWLGAAYLLVSFLVIVGLALYVLAQ